MISVICRRKSSQRWLWYAVDHALIQLLPMYLADEKAMFLKS